MLSHDISLSSNLRVVSRLSTRLLDCLLNWWINRRLSVVLEVIGGNTETHLCNQANERLTGQEQIHPHLFFKFDWKWNPATDNSCDSNWNVWATNLSSAVCDNICPDLNVEGSAFSYGFDERGCTHCSCSTRWHRPSRPAMNVQILHFTFFGCPAF